LWNHRREGAARRCFKQWSGWAIRSRLKPLIKATEMIQRHREQIRTLLRPFNNSATAEGGELKNQLIKYQARGCRRFENFRNRILFFRGQLDHPGMDGLHPCGTAGRGLKLRRVLPSPDPVWPVDLDRDGQPEILRATVWRGSMSGIQTCKSSEASL
jgi:hypothetical protein